MRRSMLVMAAMGCLIWAAADAVGQPGGGKKGGGGGAGGGPPNQGAALAEAITKEADQQFQQLDKNGDGQLNRDEMPADLKANLARFDKNGDGLIGRDEFREYFLERLTGDDRVAGPGPRGQPGGGKKGPMGPGGGQPGGFGGGGGFGGQPGGFGGGQPAGPFGATTQNPAKPMTWEYRVLTRDALAELGKEKLEVGLNQLGAEGWELIGIEAGVRRAMNSYIFRRPGTAKPRADAKPANPPMSTEKADAKIEFRVYKMKHANAVEVGRILDELMRTSRSDSLRVVADPNTNVLLLKGPTQVHFDVEAILQRLDVPSEVAAPAPGPGKKSGTFKK